MWRRGGGGIVVDDGAARLFKSKFLRKSRVDGPRAIRDTSAPSNIAHDRADRYYRGSYKSALVSRDQALSHTGIIM